MPRAKKPKLFDTELIVVGCTYEIVFRGQSYAATVLDQRNAHDTRFVWFSYPGAKRRSYMRVDLFAAMIKKQLPSQLP